MASKQGNIEAGLLLVGPTSGQLFTPDEIFEEVVNAYPTEEGSYRSISDTIPYFPDPSTGDAPSSGASATYSPLQYGPVHGVFHALLRGGQRDVTLLHTGNQVWEWRPWSAQWYPLIGPSTVSVAQSFWQAPEPEANEWATQWVSTPTGIVIIPQNGRAHFYDGVVCAPLGFDEPPAPPVGLGPESSYGQWVPASNLGGVNDSGYPWHGLPGRPTSMHEHIGIPRVGTVFSPDIATTTAGDTTHVAGYLLPGRYRARVQFIDRWGNLSPMSPPSNDVQFDRMPSQWYRSLSTDSRWYKADAARMQVGWESVDTGPQHTRGRIIWRTKDLENSGDTRWWELPADAASHPDAFATMPDRQSRFYPDNIPDAWLINPSEEFDAVPTFRLGALCFGRMWIANAEGDEGMLRYSEPGLWGTFPSAGKIYPDPKGSAITGLHAVDAGLLVFTETSTFLMTEDDSGQRFRRNTLSSTIGCVAPDSIATMRDGSTIWLSQDGFSAHSGMQVANIFETHRRQAIRINKARYGRSSGVYDNESGQYQCWVPVNGSIEPNRRYKFNGQSWHWDDYDGTITVNQACVTSDHRRLHISCGSNGSDVGVWVHDRGGDAQAMTVKTGWLRAMRSKDKASVFRVMLWLRESHSSNSTTADQIQVKTRRNWRVEVVDTKTVEPYPDISPAGSRDSYEPNPSFWDATVGASTFVRRRRPFWAAADVNISHAEVFQLEISCPKGFEIMGLTFSEKPAADGGASSRR